MPGLIPIWIELGCEGIIGNDAFRVDGQVVISQCGSPLAKLDIASSQQLGVLAIYFRIRKSEVARMVLQMRLDPDVLRQLRGEISKVLGCGYPLVLVGIEQTLCPDQAEPGEDDRRRCTSSRLFHQLRGTLIAELCAHLWIKRII